ncbi:hypothetical protein CH296_01135 [Rhodococcus sp. 14-2496-1d]|nr:hypothetical protein CH296_01135 [Rhodococcus sp. 14-2496-1d]
MVTSEPPGTQDDNFLFKIPRWLGENQLWVLGLTPVALVSLNLLFVASGDLATLRVLIRGIDPLTAILGSILPIMPMVLLYLVPYVMERRLFGEPLPKWTAPVVLAVVVTGAVTLPSSMFVLLSLLGAMLVFSIFEWFQARSGRARVRVFRPFTAAVLVVVSSASAGPWIPTEVVSVRGDAAVTAYVMGTEDGWTTLVRVGGGVSMVESGNIDARVVCNERHRGRTVIETLTNRPESNPNCDDVPSEPGPEE